MSYNLLKGKKGIIFGALNEQSIAWKVAERAHEEGAEIVLTNAPIALRMGTIHELAKLTKAEVIAADATSLEDLENLFNRSMEVFGGKVDFILHSIGMSPNVRKGLNYDELNYDYYHKTLDVSAFSFHKVLSTARKMDAINEWGSVVALSYVAAQRTFQADPHQYCFTIPDANHGRQRGQRIRQAGRFLRPDVPAGQCLCSGLCRLLRHPVFRSDPEGYHAEPVPRRRVLQHGHELQGH
jgi:hypothetical protein